MAGGADQIAFTLHHGAPLYVAIFSDVTLCPLPRFYMFRIGLDAAFLEEMNSRITVRLPLDQLVGQYGYAGDATQAINAWRQRLVKKGMFYRTAREAGIQA